jgi:hypothetical protein
MRRQGASRDGTTFPALDGAPPPTQALSTLSHHRRQAEIHERAGRPAEAVEHYERFIELWAEADSELRPMVADARRRAASLR